MKKDRDNIYITVITATYNLIQAGRKDFFRQCIESVHNQTYKNIEHIVVDGGSKDGSLDLIKEYAKKGWIKYISEKDTGVYDAMNKGLKLATGDYIGFLNSDDYYHDNKGIQRMVDFILLNKPDFCYGPCNFITERGNFYGVSKPVIGSFFCHMPFSHQTLFVNTKLMRKLGGFDAINFKNAGDYDFIIRLCLAGAKGCEFNMNFVNYRMGGLSEKFKDESNAECIKIFSKNFTDFGVGFDANKLLYDFILPIKLYNHIYQCVNKEIQDKMDAIWKTRKQINQNYAKITEIQTVYHKEEGDNKMYTTYNLFDFIPLLKTKQRWGVKRYLLFGFLPIIKKKENDDGIKYYLLSFIPLISKEYRKNVNYNYVDSGEYSFAGTLPFENDGLYGAENWGCWSKGDKTNFYLSADSKCRATFDVQAFLAKGKEQQKVYVYVNGIRKKHYFFKSDKTPQKIVVKLPKSKKIHIMFRYHNIKSPSDLGISDDTRKIVLGFKTLKLQEE